MAGSDGAGNRACAYRSPRYKSRRGPAAFDGPPGPKLCGLEAGLALFALTNMAILLITLIRPGLI